DPVVLRRAATDNVIPTKLIEVETLEEARLHRAPRELAIMPISRIDDPALGWGRPTESSDRAQIAYIEAAYREVARKKAGALVTAPINKTSLARAGAHWPGHTEMLAELSGVERPVMMLAGPTLKVVPLTVHVPLAEVPKLLTIDKILHAIRITDAA